MSTSERASEEFFGFDDAAAEPAQERVQTGTSMISSALGGSNLLQVRGVRGVWCTVHSPVVWQPADKLFPRLLYVPALRRVVLAAFRLCKIYVLRDHTSAPF
jgi:hypothetical protein